MWDTNSIISDKKMQNVHHALKKYSYPPFPLFRSIKMINKLE